MVRCPHEDSAIDASAFAALIACSTQVATYYTTAYISKVQPHLASCGSRMKASSQMYGDVSKL